MVANIATLPTYRSRGIGAAITARAVSDGRRSGASWAYLQSSAMGYPLYERMGFTTVERWAFWVSAD